MKKIVIIVAGGKGSRMGNDLPKQFIPIEGKPILMHTLEAFHHWDENVDIILVLPKEHQDYWQMLNREIGCLVPHQIVDGGETRFHSVKNGLMYISEELGFTAESKTKALIAVHDGVRPFPASDVIDNCFNSASAGENAIPVIPIIDSLRFISDHENRPADRSKYYIVQTPQVFRSDILQKAYQQANTSCYTDDASVVEALGKTIQLVPGNRENIKITTPFDLLIAKAICNHCL